MKYQIFPISMLTLDVWINSYLRCSSFVLLSRGSRLGNRVPRSSTVTPTQGKHSTAACVHLEHTWPHTAPPPRQPSAHRADRGTTPRCGTTCPDVSTAATCASTTWKWRGSAPRSATVSVGAKRVSSWPMMITVSNTGSVSQGLASKQKVTKAAHNCIVHLRDVPF